MDRWLESDRWIESVRALLPMFPDDVIEHITHLAMHEVCAVCGKAVLDRDRFVQLRPYYIDEAQGKIRCQTCAAWRRIFYLRERVARHRSM